MSTMATLRKHVEAKDKYLPENLSHFYELRKKGELRTGMNVQIRRMELFAWGAFGNVYRAQVAEDGRLQEVAVKKTWINGPQAQNKTIPEVHFVKTAMADCKNIVRLRYSYLTTHKERWVCQSLIFEFMPATLQGYCQARNGKIDLLDIKLFTWQIFRGLLHLQKRSVIHRDIKPQNLLVEPSPGLLKISDFGSSATYKVGNRLPPYQVTRFYRAPELLLEAKKYGCGVDIWATGCVLAELFIGHPLFAGDNSQHQLDLIVDCFGVPMREEAAAMHCPVRTYNLAETNYSPAGPFPKIAEMRAERMPAKAVELLNDVLGCIFEEDEEPTRTKENRMEKRRPLTLCI